MLLGFCLIFIGIYSVGIPTAVQILLYITAALEIIVSTVKFIKAVYKQAEKNALKQNAPK